ncbi:hypothetical protein Q4Q39_09565 [Flavivirga amylovorans]|uniref:Thioredoxin domain-containing protein n=1 Tax=Flavivirga amylovorans TaxID=870486 RepID=A0ABT8X140_9FLAO|nr:hypothetical protein [Flavivirga amylovorans]MDO5987644.1 hypothetical protein [Flavivirga amylovorans]
MLQRNLGVLFLNKKVSFFSAIVIFNNALTALYKYNTYFCTIKYYRGIFMKLYFSAILLVLLALSSCKDTSDIKDRYAYIGGEIINPTTNYVVLFKTEAIIDTIKLDNRNRFLYKVNNLEEGLYSFRHGYEYQMILLEPKDSVLFRLNTLDFDESLVFTGKGAKKNNYLINEFLENEIEEKYIFKLCQLTPTIYQNRIDSLRSLKVKSFKSFKSRHKVSPLFEKIALANIDYDYYSSKEIYPFVHYGKDKVAILKSLPEDFYNYRKDINYNDDLSIHYYKYNKFLRYTFSNLSLIEHGIHSNDEHFNRYSLCYNLDRLKLIDSLVTNTSIKDELLYELTINYISKNKNIENNNVVLKSYLNKTKSKKGKKELTSFTNALNNLKIGSNFPDIKLINYENVEFDINSIIKSPTAISFWSHTFHKHFKDSHKKLKELEKKYPEVVFITINIDDYGLEKPKKSLKKYRFSSKNEYTFKNPKEASRALAIYPMTKVMIVDQNKKIVNNNTNIFSIKFEKQLLDLINR